MSAPLYNGTKQNSRGGVNVRVRGPRGSVARSPSGVVRGFAGDASSWRAIDDLSGGTISGLEVLNSSAWSGGLLLGSVRRECTSTTHHTVKDNTSNATRTTHLIIVPASFVFGGLRDGRSALPIGTLTRTVCDGALFALCPTLLRSNIPRPLLRTWWPVLNKDRQITVKLSAIAVTMTVSSMETCTNTKQQSMRVAWALQSPESDAHIINTFKSSFTLAMA